MLKIKLLTISIILLSLLFVLSSCELFFPIGTQKWASPLNFINHDYYSSLSIGSDGTIYFGSGKNEFYAINPDGNTKVEI